jgi:phosphoethanolamine N-methyltransferase
MPHFLALLFCVISSLGANNVEIIAPTQPSIDVMENEYGNTRKGNAITGILEFLYGNTFMSAGGTDSVDIMLKGLSLSNKKLVDIGCGFGGADIYLAQKYPTTIIGLDPVKKTIQGALKNAHSSHLTKQLSYIHTPSLPYPLENESVDIVFSKEALLHAPNKKEIILEIFRILKPGGQLRIIDWVFGRTTSQATKDSFNIPSFNVISQNEYVRLLKGAGFMKVSTERLNEKYCTYTQQTINHLKKNKDAWSKSEIDYPYEDALADWENQYTTFKSKELLVTLFKAKKPFLKKRKNSPIAALHNLQKI